VLTEAVADPLQSYLSALLILLLLVLVLVVLIILLILLIILIVVLLVLVLIVLLILIILHFTLRSPPNEISQPQSAEHRLFFKQKTLGY